MSRRQQLEELRSRVEVLGPYGGDTFKAILELLEQAVFVDELPPELARAVVAKRSERGAAEKRTWRRRYRCKKHGTITGPLCGDCAQEKVSAHSLVEEIES